MVRTAVLVISLVVSGATARYLAAQERVRLESPYRGGKVTIDADRAVRESDDRWTAEGNVVAVYQDHILKTARLVYRPAQQEVLAEGGVEITQGVQWLKGSRAELNLANDTGVLYDAEGYTDQQLFVKAKLLIKTGPDTYETRNGILTACAEPVPKWSFSASKAVVPLDGTAHLSHTVFRIKKVPVLYLPALLLPTGKKERSSGFLLPTLGNSSNKGRRINQSFYLTLGRSADVTFHELYYSQRGFGQGVTFRTRPNSVSMLDLDGFAVRDRKGQGGASLTALGETIFGGGYRAVADFNLLTNFVFRQVFSDDFYIATRPTESSRFFITNNFQSGSVNLLLSREETFFPGRHVVVRHTPSLSFRLTGRRIGRLPLYLDLDTSLRGLSRVDRNIETPGVTQRLDFSPQLYLSVPLFQGLRLTPRLGLRETYYSDSLTDPDGAGVYRLSGRDLNRRYLEFTTSLEGWGLSRVYRQGSAAAWKHLIEPTLRYRWVGGVDEYEHVIRFDEHDAVVNTNEVEYGIVNRFFVKRKIDVGVVNHQWLSIKVAQKRFFDPDFGGAFQPNSVNQFFPFYSMTGFLFGGTRRSVSPVVSLVRFSPEPSVSFDVRSDFDSKFGQFRNFSLTGFYNRSRLSLGTSYFITRKLEPGSFESNQIQGHLSVGNRTRGLSLSSVFSYDARTSRFLNFQSTAHYFWNCCGVSVELQTLNIGLRQERQIRFAVYLKGLGTFGTIRHPTRVF
jgi:LPS-assembly protein